MASKTSTTIKFGKFKFEVNPAKKIMPVSGYSRSASYTADDIEKSKRKPSTHKKGPGLEKQSFDVMLTKALGVDPLATYNSLKKMCESGKEQYLLMGKTKKGAKRVGSYKWLLKSVSMGDAELDASGNIRSCTVSLDFDEYVRAGKPKKK